MDFLITGVRRGIGHGVAERLIAAGHRVFGVVRPGADAGGLALTGVVEVDLEQPAAIAAAVATLADHIERLDGLVHSAGIIGGPLTDTPPSALERLFAVNVGAAAEIVRCFVPQLRAAGGTVVLVNSTSGLSAGPPLSSYGASKYALRGYADALRAEEPELRVTSVYPSRTATGMQRELRALEQQPYVAEDYLRPETVAGLITQALLLPDDAVITDLVVRPRPQRR